MLKHKAFLIPDRDVVIMPVLRHCAPKSPINAFPLCCCVVRDQCLEIRPAVSRIRA